ncbi:hypothetical protein V6U78_12715 [Marinospirillum sp. MEB164]|uniref:Uncharacterized protein n=1 Tax=Marinospirillum alkalitolerans TaxID=3123374 RepID=A0ABW8Q010_9GAMM
MMRTIEKSAMTLARAADGNPIITTVVTILFFLGFNILEGQIELLIWGERFPHWLDPIFIVGFMAYAAYSVYACAVFNSAKQRV